MQITNAGIITKSNSCFVPPNLLFLCQKTLKTSQSTCWTQQVVSENSHPSLAPVNKHEPSAQNNNNFGHKGYVLAKIKLFLSKAGKFRCIIETI